MAEEDQGDRTEQPSQRKLERAFDEGKLGLGRDAAMVAGLGAGTLALASLAPSLRDALVRMVGESVRSLPQLRFGVFPGMALGAAGSALAVCAAAALAGVAVTVAQTRGRVWPHLALPDLSRLWGGARLNLLRRDLWIDLGMATVKVVALAWAAWSSLHADFLTLPGLLGAAPGDQLAQAFRIAGRIFGRMLLVALVIAGADLAIQRWRFTSRMKMTRQEAKREAREDEGDPLLRGRRRKRHRDLSRGRAVVEVPRADALLVNPTHVAVALRYRRDEGRAPRVTAKGKGVLAETMRDLARQHGVPIVEDIPLARLLYRKVKVGGEVPSSTYKAVAAILAFVYRLGGRAPQPPAGSQA